jgi:septum formation protein
MKLLLASKSPRRRQLLSQLGYPVEFVDIDVDEHVPSDTPAAEMAELIARRKADAYPKDLIFDDAVVVTADTVVVLGDRPLGKPASRQQAIDMLHALSGRHHSVCTGVCLRSFEQTVHFSERTDVFFRELSDEEIIHYVDTYRPFDKAGAYGIQEWIGMVGISRIEGCYYNVMGLPLAALYSHLQVMLDKK